MALGCGSRHPHNTPLEGMPRLTLDPDPSEEPFLYRLNQVMNWLLRGDDEPQVKPCKAQPLTGRACQQPFDLGLVASMRFTLQATPLATERDEWSARTTPAASTPAGIARALDALATAGKAVYIVFISANEQGRRWGDDCAAAETAIAGVLRGRLHGAGKIDLVEAAVPQAQWRRRPSAERHPFRDSEAFGRIQLPLILKWVDGRVAGRLCAPAIADPRQVRAFFERSSPRAATSPTATAASTAAVRLEALLTDDHVDPRERVAPANGPHYLDEIVLDVRSND